MVHSFALRRKHFHRKEATRELVHLLTKTILLKAKMSSFCFYRQKNLPQIEKARFQALPIGRPLQFEAPAIRWAARDTRAERRRRTTCESLFWQRLRKTKQRFPFSNLSLHSRGSEPDDDGHLVALGVMTEQRVASRRAPHDAFKRAQRSRRSHSSDEGTVSVCSTRRFLLLFF